MRIATIYILLIISVLWACNAPPTQERAIDIRRTILTWLDCEECREGSPEELAVIALGREAVSILEEELENGPSPAKIALYEAQLEKKYKVLEEFSSNPKDSVELNITLLEYQEFNLTRYQNQYKLKAAIALSDMNTQNALDIIKQFLDKAQSSKLTKQIEGIYNSKNLEINSNPGQ